MYKLLWKWIFCSKCVWKLAGFYHSPYLYAQKRARIGFSFRNDGYGETVLSCNQRFIFNLLLYFSPFYYLFAPKSELPFYYLINIYLGAVSLTVIFSLFISAFNKWIIEPSASYSLELRTELHRNFSFEWNKILGKFVWKN